MDRFHKKEIKEYLQQMDLKVAHFEGKYLFTHSGVIPRWVEEFDIKLEDLEKLPLNHPSLLSVSPYRGGLSIASGSCIWGDVREYYNSYHYKDYYQIFGHTQLEREIITNDFACLDCRKAFILDTETNEITNY